MRKKMRRRRGKEESLEARITPCIQSHRAAVLSGPLYHSTPMRVHVRQRDDTFRGRTAICLAGKRETAFGSDETKDDLRLFFRFELPLPAKGTLLLS